MTTKYGAYRAYRRQTITAGADFLHHLKTKFPFRIKAIQIDGGSEFKDQFEEACRSLEITLFVNPPRCPEMNGGVERLNRTSREEFYEVEDLALVTKELNRQLEEWEHTYNYIRPHEGTGPGGHSGLMRQAKMRADPALTIEPQVGASGEEALRTRVDDEILRAEHRICDAAKDPLKEIWRGRLVYLQIDTYQWIKMDAPAIVGGPSYGTSMKCK